MLGHSTIGATLDDYNHVAPALHTEAARQFDLLLGAVTAVIRPFRRADPERWKGRVGATCTHDRGPAACECSTAGALSRPMMPA
jgi:hypothetical protein